MNARRQYTDEDLNAYLDGELTEPARMDVEAWLNEEPEAAQRLRDTRLLNDRLRAAFEPVLTEPKTLELQRKVLARRRRPVAVDWRMLAAGLAIAVVSGAAGYGLHGLVERREPPSSLAEGAIGAHAVFVTEVRHPVEVAASEEAHLIAWLTKRVGQALKAPVLTSAGYKLIGGRLLADSGQPAAQFMYEDGSGRRLTLYVRRDMKHPSTSFEFTTSSVAAV